MPGPSLPAPRPPADGYTSRFPATHADAVLVVSFGGPEGPDDVIPFLENVTRGRNVPRERLAEVGRHYDLVGGVSPINAQNRALVAALRDELARRSLALPVYLGNRNWHPLLTETLAEMAEAGITKALAFLTSAYSSYSGCRQYRENLYDAQRALGDRAPEVLRLRAFYNHPGFIAANADHVRAALDALPLERRADAHVAFTAHSIPTAMARASRYEQQLGEAARLVADAVGATDTRVVFQSRSGAPHVPWLEPDVSDHLAEVHERGVTDVVVAPIGFVSDHMEVIYDLDVEAARTAADLGLNLVRASTASTHPAFVSMVGELVEERLDPDADRRALGRHGASHDVCPVDCCRPGTGRPSPWETAAA
jgi:protoporphyrin/coproporphyrin ferrochelatase